MTSYLLARIWLRRPGSAAAIARCWPVVGRHTSADNYDTFDYLEPGERSSQRPDRVRDVLPEHGEWRELPGHQLDVQRSEHSVHGDGQGEAGGSRQRAGPGHGSEHGHHDDRDRSHRRASPGPRPTTPPPLGPSAAAIRTPPFPCSARLPGNTASPRPLHCRPRFSGDSRTAVAGRLNAERRPDVARVRRHGLVRSLLLRAQLRQPPERRRCLRRAIRAVDRRSARRRHDRDQRCAPVQLRRSLRTRRSTRCPR